MLPVTVRKMETGRDNRNVTDEFLMTNWERKEKENKIDQEICKYRKSNAFFYPLNKFH